MRRQELLDELEEIRGQLSVIESAVEQGRLPDGEFPFLLTADRVREIKALVDGVREHQVLERTFPQVCGPDDAKKDRDVLLAALAGLLEAVSV